MSINYSELKKIADSLLPILEQSTIQEITQLSPDELYIETRKAGYTYPIIVKVHHKFTFLGKGKPYRNAPLSPYNFTSSLRKHLILKKIFTVSQVENDRILQIDIPPYKLVLELTGRNGNIFLLNNNKIINALFKRNGQKRKELPEEQYVYLPNPSTKMYFPRPEIETFSSNTDFAENVVLYYYKLIALDEMEKDIHTKSLGLEKANEYLEKINKSIRNNQNCEIENEKGNLLLSYQKDINRFPVLSEDNDKKIIVVPSFDQSKSHEILINKRLSAALNAAAYFAHYKKMKKRLIELEKQKIAAENEVKNYSDALSVLLDLKLKISDNTISPSHYLKHVYADKSKQERLKNKKDPKVIILHTRSGKSVIIGKTAQTNAYGLKKYGRGNYWWFHCRDYPGSFVILQEENLTIEEIEDCSTMALFFSKGRNNAKGEIIYTRCKHVKQIPGLAGKVTYSNESNYIVAADYSLMKKFNVKN